ncbi:MAG TPA: ROK family protein, partial [Armatimonadota bacterium]|nr:ROK family protein [Armatimonadota bacterium]
GNLVQTLNPEIVVLGTIAVHARDVLMDHVKASAKQHAWPRAWEAVRIAPAKLGTQVGDLAALCCALNAGN